MTRLVRKIRRVAASDLALASKFRYLRDLAIGSLRHNLRKGLSGISLARRYIRVPARKFDRREGFRRDFYSEKTYAPYARAQFRRAAPVILIDLGANIGLSVISLARELRPLAIVAVEPDRGNFATLQENLRLAGLQDLCTSIRAFAGTQRGFAELVDSGNGAWGMRMGAAAKTGIPVLPIEHIISMAEPMAGAARGLRQRSRQRPRNCDSGTPCYGPEMRHRRRRVAPVPASSPMGGSRPLRDSGAAHGVSVRGGLSRVPRRFALPLAHRWSDSSRCGACRRRPGAAGVEGRGAKPACSRLLAGRPSPLHHCRGSVGRAQH